MHSAAVSQVPEQGKELLRERKKTQNLSVRYVGEEICRRGDEKRPATSFERQEHVPMS